jgi:hypothetical protein
MLRIIGGRENQAKENSKEKVLKRYRNVEMGDA